MSDTLAVETSPGATWRGRQTGDYEGSPKGLMQPMARCQSVPEKPCLLSAPFHLCSVSELEGLCCYARTILPDSMAGTHAAHVRYRSADRAAALARPGVEDLRGQARACGLETDGAPQCLLHSIHVYPYTLRMNPTVCS